MEKNKKQTPKKIKIPKPPKQTPSEEELVKKYAEKIIKATQNRGQKSGLDTTKKTTNVNLWMDVDFFFSVVFQSQKQKETFLLELHKKMGIDFTKSLENSIQIINGLQFAKMLGINLTEESLGEYPYYDLHLKQLVLDAEEF